MQETQVQYLGQEDPLEKEMATHSSSLAGIIPLPEEPGGLQSMELQRVGHNLVTKQQQKECVAVCFIIPHSLLCLYLEQVSRLTMQMIFHFITSLQTFPQKLNVYKISGF